MFSVLLGNGMSIIWHGHEANWTEPIASIICRRFSHGWVKTAAIVIFYMPGGFIYYSS